MKPARTHPYPNFYLALVNLAPTHEARAAILGCSKRSVISYLQGEALPHVEKVKRIQALDEALTCDIRPSEHCPEMMHIPA